jgi:mono/diheme cytochrome c family protein
MVSTAAQKADAPFDPKAFLGAETGLEQMRRAMAMVLALVLLALPAAAQDPSVGGSLAVRWCMSCHVVEPNQGTATDNAPTFRAIAAQPGTTAGSLDRYLSVGHTLMPDFSLSSQERNALVAYILSLR